MHSFIKTLEQKKYQPKVIENYKLYLKAFFSWIEEAGLTVESCQYTDLLSFIKNLKEAEKSIENINCHLRGIRYYYEFLLSEESGETIPLQHNPAKNLYLKGNIQKLPEDLLSKEELNQLYEEYPEDSYTRKRNKLMLGLVIYQALRQDELAALREEDINLYKGSIHIRKTGRGARRTVKLEAKQILPLQEYIQNVRPELLKLAAVPTDKLLMSLGKHPGLKELISDLLKTLRKKYPRLKNFQQIRSSVISHWVNEKNIREVQYLAGHNSIISTERYKQANLKDLKRALDKYHPLK